MRTKEPNQLDINQRADIFDIIRHGDMKALNLLVEQGFNAWGNSDRDGRTPIQFAVQEGRVEVLEFLAQKGFNAWNVRNCVGRTLAFAASRYGRVDVLGFLVEHGVDLFARDNYGITLAHVAAENGNVGVLKFLVARGFTDWNAVGSDRSTPLDYVINSYKRLQDLLERSEGVVNRFIEVLEFLIGQGVNISGHCVALAHEAAANGDVPMLEFLERHGFNAWNGVDGNRKTLAHFSINSSKGLRYLIKRGFSNWNVEDPSGRTCLGYMNAEGAQNLKELQLASYTEILSRIFPRAVAEDIALFLIRNLWGQHTMPNDLSSILAAANKEPPGFTVSICSDPTNWGNFVPPPNSDRGSVGMRRKKQRWEKNASSDDTTSSDTPPSDTPSSQAPSSGGSPSQAPSSVGSHINTTSDGDSLKSSSSIQKEEINPINPLNLLEKPSDEKEKVIVINGIRYKIVEKSGYYFLEEKKDIDMNDSSSVAKAKSIDINFGDNVEEDIVTIDSDMMPKEITKDSALPEAPIGQSHPLRVEWNGGGIKTFVEKGSYEAPTTIAGGEVSPFQAGAFVPVEQLVM